MVRRLPLFAPVWVSSTVGALIVVFTRPPVARIRYGSILLPTLTRNQVKGRWRAAQDREVIQRPFGSFGS